MVFDVKKVGVFVGINGVEILDDVVGGKYGYCFGYLKNGYFIFDWVFNLVDDRELKVIIIGVGVSGILMVYLI